VIVNFKLAVGGAFGPHIDKGGHKEYGSNEHISLAVAIDVATVENGCIEVIEGVIRWTSLLKMELVVSYDAFLLSLT